MTSCLNCVDTKMAHIPATVGKHLDAIEIKEDGHLLLASSTLTYRYWNGSLWHYSNADLAPDVEQCAAGVEVDDGVQDLKWIKDSEKFVIGTDSGSVELWEISDEGHTMQCITRPSEHDGIVNTVSVSADQSRVASASQDTRIKIWDMDEFVAVNTFKAHADIVTSAVFHPQQHTVFVSTSQDGRILLWDLRKPKPAIKISGMSLPSSPTCVAWQPSLENSVVIGTESGHMVLLDLRLPDEPCVTVKPHSRSVHRIVFSPKNATWFASVSEDCTAVVTEYAAGSAAAIYRDSSHTDFVQGVAWHPDGRLFTSSWDFAIHSRQVTPNLEGESELVEEVTEKLRKKVETMDTTTEGEGNESK